MARLRSRLAPLLVLVVAACSSTPSSSPAGVPTATPALTANPRPAPTRSPSPTPTSTPSPTPEPTRAGAIVPGTVDRTSLDVIATYDVALDVDVATGELAVDVAIDARNESGEPIDRLELNTIAARLGRLVVTAAAVDGTAVGVSVDDQTLIVPLGGLLPAGASASVALTYTATLRNDLDGSDWLFTRAGGTLALYRWIPWVSRAVPFDRPNHGDPFVTPSSPSVRVDISTDRPMVLASASAEAVGAGRAWTLTAHDVRDVAIVLAPDFVVTTGEAGAAGGTGAAGGIPVRAYTRPSGLDGGRLVAQARHALTSMADRLRVAYPWPAFTVVETAGGYGMESPGLIWIPRSVTAVNLPYLVHHETAHQWFYGLVGNDQQAEPFADEAAADLLARTVLGNLRASRCDRAPLDRSILRYSAACYYEVVYIQGGNVLDDLRALMGSERFWTALRDYVEANRFGIGGTRQLLETLRAASPVDLLPTLRARFPDLY